MKISIVLTGHSRWSEGLLASHDLIAENNELVKNINFDGDSKHLDSYGQEVENLVKNQLEISEECWILTDIVGGTPFQTGARLATNNPKIKVFGGINMPFLASLSIDKETIPEDSRKFIEELIEASRNALTQF